MSNCDSLLNKTKSVCLKDFKSMINMIKFSIPLPRPLTRKAANEFLDIVVPSCSKYQRSQLKNWIDKNKEEKKEESTMKKRKRQEKKEKEKILEHKKNKWRSLVWNVSIERSRSIELEFLKNLRGQFSFSSLSSYQHSKRFIVLPQKYNNDDDYSTYLSDWDLAAKFRNFVRNERFISISPSSTSSTTPSYSQSPSNSNNGSIPSLIPMHITAESKVQLRERDSELRPWDVSFVSESFGSCWMRLEHFSFIQNSNNDENENQKENDFIFTFALQPMGAMVIPICVSLSHTNSNSEKLNEIVGPEYLFNFTVNFQIPEPSTLTENDVDKCLENPEQFIDFYTRRLNITHYLANAKGKSIQFLGKESLVLLKEEKFDKYKIGKINLSIDFPHLYVSLLLHDFLLPSGLSYLCIDYLS